MSALFNSEFAPITFVVGFLDVGIEDFLTGLLRWRRTHFEQVDDRLIDGALPEGLTRLAPLSMPPRRALLWATESKWTAYFDNSIAGTDAFTPIAYLARKMHCHGLIATCVPHTLSARSNSGASGAIVFEVLGPTETEYLNYVRSVGVRFEDRWEFQSFGKPFDFEAVDQYRVAQVPARFTPELLARYCASLGVRLFDPGFYRGPGHLVTVRDPLPRVSREVSLAEAQRDLGLPGG